MTIERERALEQRRRGGRADARRRPARRRRRLPGPARPLRRGRQRPGAARVARRPLRRLRRARLGDLHGQADPEAPLRASAAFPRSTSSQAGEEGWRAALRASWACRSGSSPRGSAPASASPGSTTSAELDAAVELAPRHDPRVIVEASASGREVECSVLGNEEPRDLACRARSSPTPTGTTSRPSTTEGGMELRVPAPISDDRRPPASASSPPRSSLWPAAPASPAATSSSSPTARCWSTRSTRCPASPRPASTPSCSRPRHRLPGPLRPPRRARGRAPPQRPLLRVLSARAQSISFTSAISSLEAAVLVARRGALVNQIRKYLAGVATSSSTSAVSPAFGYLADRFAPAGEFFRAGRRRRRRSPRPSRARRGSTISAGVDGGLGGRRRGRRPGRAALGPGEVGGVVVLGGPGGAGRVAVDGEADRVRLLFAVALGVEVGCRGDRDRRALVLQRARRPRRRRC